MAPETCTDYRLLVPTEYIYDYQYPLVQTGFDLTWLRARRGVATSRLDMPIFGYSERPIVVATVPESGKLEISLASLFPSYSASGTELDTCTILRAREQVQSKKGRRQCAPVVPLTDSNQLKPTHVRRLRSCVHRG